LHPAVGNSRAKQKAYVAHICIGTAQGLGRRASALCSIEVS